MKTLLLLTLALFFPCIVSADDVDEAKAAFATLLEYQKTDDPRCADLFTQDFALTITLSDGTVSRTATYPPEVFREILTQALALKQGNKDIYEDVKFAQEESGVKVTSTILYAQNFKHGAFSALYVRSGDVLKIKEMKATVPVETLP